MTRSGPFPDRVRVSHTNHGYFRSCAGEQRQEDPHGAFLRSGCAAHVFVRRGCLYGVGRALAGSGLHGQLGARRAGGGSAPKTWLNRCLRVLFRSARRNASPRKSRPGTRRDRVC